MFGNSKKYLYPFSFFLTILLIFLSILLFFFNDKSRIKIILEWFSIFFYIYSLYILIISKGKMNEKDWFMYFIAMVFGFFFMLIGNIIS